VLKTATRRRPGNIIFGISGSFPQFCSYPRGEIEYPIAGTCKNDAGSVAKAGGPAKAQVVQPHCALKCGIVISRVNDIILVLLYSNRTTEWHFSVFLKQYSNSLHS
jgi:hypothetical protein